MDALHQLEVLGQFVLALVLGGIIGAERELARKPAGFRTQMIVAGTSALLVVLAEEAVRRFSGAVPAELIRSDATRILQAIVTGISFLGAGTIFRSPRRVEGLTTAATILLSSAIGIAVGLREYILAIGATILALVVLHGLSAFNRWFRRKTGASSAEE